MKNLVLTLIFTLLGIGANAQNKNAVADFKVKGNCNMCKARIEKAAYKVKGVKVAEWDKNSKNLHVIINEKKTNLKELKKAIAAVGHDTDEVKAEESVYANLEKCCQYNRLDSEEETYTH